jgi:hypothetical protein
MTPAVWRRVAATVDAHRRPLMNFFMAGILTVIVVFGLLAAVFWSFRLMFLGLWLVFIQFFWCFGLYLLVSSHGPAEADEPKMAISRARNGFMEWYGAIFLDVAAAMLVFFTLFGPAAILLSPSS